MESTAKTTESHWAGRKHAASKRTDVHNLIRGMLENELKIPQNPHKPLVTLGLGEPTKANGYDLPPVINEAMIEAV